MMLLLRRVVGPVVATLLAPWQSAEVGPKCTDTSRWHVSRLTLRDSGLAIVGNPSETFAGRKIDSVTLSDCQRIPADKNS